MSLSLTDHGDFSLAEANTSTRSATSSAFTPAANSLLVVMFSSECRSSGIANTLSNTHGGSGSWTVVESPARNVGASGIYSVTGVAWCRMGAAPGSGTVTLTQTPTGTISRAMNATVIAVSSTAGQASMRQTKTLRSAVASPSLTFDTSVLASSIVVAALSNYWGGTITDPSGFTELSSQSNGGSVIFAGYTFDVSYDATSPPSTFSWSGGSTVADDGQTGAAIEVFEEVLGTAAQLRRAKLVPGVGGRW